MPDPIVRHCAPSSFPGVSMSIVQNNMMRKAQMRPGCNNKTGMEGEKETKVQQYTAEHTACQEGAFKHYSLSPFSAVRSDDCDKNAAPPVYRPNIHMRTGADRQIDVAFFFLTPRTSKMPSTALLYAVQVCSGMRGLILCICVWEAFPPTRRSIGRSIHCSGRPI